ncbi:3-ketodihydrosphingosine reductase [Oratosquilla oratoria]|uniref:3-ketodihydrosphingosine reductase n=1 Tax=Oratosquilla oratoria TaxID=337810 RepID=UPI003F7710BC
MMELCCLIDCGLVCLGLGALCFLTSYLTRKTKEIRGKHVLVTGGSSGIGLSVAQQAAAKGANVTLVARNVKRLEEAQMAVEKTIHKVGGANKVQYYSVDLGGDVNAIGEMVKEAEKSFGPIYMLVNCAGLSIPLKFEDISPAQVKTQMDVNFFGSFFVSQEVVKSMKQQNEGIIVFISSLGGLLGLYGFTAYSASKAAVIKMAEALHMEVKPYNISVTVSFPPDTDTPGFVEENKIKPVETKLISEAAGLFSADDVAKKLLADALSGEFMSTSGIDGFMLTTMCAGMSPITSITSFFSQVFLMGPFRVISAFYLWQFNSIVKKEYQKRVSSKKSE